MPRKSKDKIETIVEKDEKKAQKISKSSTKSSSSNKMSQKSLNKTTTIKKAPKNPSFEKHNSSIDKTNKLNSTKEVKSKSKNTKKTSNAKLPVSHTKEKIEVLEYYDLPYHYNETVVKLLAQTPTSLFVYWDISDYDKSELAVKYGEKFFSETKPILLIHNETMNYTFEVEINDFANCWYLHVNDTKCIYNIKLCRKYVKPISNNLNDDLIYITSSNNIEAPNNQILFNTLNNSIYFKNVKTNKLQKRKVSSFSAIKNMGNIYNIYDLYNHIYPEENFSTLNLNNPSSTCTSSTFKI